MPLPSLLALSHPAAKGEEVLFGLASASFDNALLGWRHLESVSSFRSSYWVRPRSY